MEGPRALGARLVGIGRDTYTAWRADRTHRLGAGLAYYALFTFVPLLALTAAIAGLVFGRADFEAYLAERLERLEVFDAEGVAVAMTDELSRFEVQSSIGIAGLVSVFFGASLLFLALVDAINTIWDVPVASGFWNTVRRRLVAFLMVLLTIALIAVEFAVSAITGAAEALIPGEVDLLSDLADLLSVAASGVSLFLLLTLLFRYLSPSPLAWRISFFSAATTAVLLAVGSWAFGLYFRHFGGASIAGAFGALLAALTFVYYEAQILLGGVQLSKVLHRRAGQP